MKTILLMITVFVMTAVAEGAYVETMDPDGLTMNLKTDFGLVDDQAESNQSERLQKAIDEVSAKGGGRLIVPKGVYRFGGISLKSNMHLLIEKDTVIKPYWPKGTKTIVFGLGIGRNAESVENVSIRGLGGKFIVDYEVPLSGL